MPSQIELNDARARRPLDSLARNLVGDGKDPNLYFVSNSFGVILVTGDFQIAYDAWRALPRSRESSLEDRKVGTLAGTEPVSDAPGARLMTYDDTRMYGPTRLFRRNGSGSASLDVRVRGHKRRTK